MKFIVIEGLDGSGKSTQIEMLQNYLADQQIKYKYLHFPRLDKPPFGELVSKFLRGEFGSLEQVHPYLVALIYAEDRNDAKEMINQWLAEGNLVVIDRYVHSNIAYQCPKVKDEAETDKLKNWILDLEFNYFRIPRPNLNIFLDVPFAFTEKKLTDERNGEDRTYLQGSKDIHESDLDFQKRVKEIYIASARNDSNFRTIKCSNDGVTILPPEEIFSRIICLLQGEQII